MMMIEFRPVKFHRGGAGVLDWSESPGDGEKALLGRRKKTCRRRGPVGTVPLGKNRKERKGTEKARRERSPDDIPREGSTVNKGEPICSVLKFSSSWREVVTDAFATAKKIYKLCRS